MSNGTDRPKRAAFSLRSMMVMCLAFIPLLWMNVVDREGDRVLSTSTVTVAPEYGNRGFPWTYRIEIRDFRILSASGRLVQRTEIEPLVKVAPLALLLNVAVAVAVSISLALASERFVFRRLRRGPPPDPMEAPK